MTQISDNPALARVDRSTSQIVEQGGEAQRPIPPEPSAGYMILRAMEMMSVPGSGITVDTLERLVALKEREDAKKAERLLDAALLAVKTGCPQILKTREVYGKDTDQAGNRREKPMMYRYANLEDVKLIVDPRLAANDLSYTWDVEGVPGAMFTVCTVRHSGGGKRSARFPWAGAKAPTMNEAQAAGSSATYGQRYSLLAVLGLSADLDDDGRSAEPGAAPDHDATAPKVGTREERRAANESTSQPPAQPPVKPPAQPPVNPKLVAIRKLMADWQKWAEKPQGGNAEFAAWAKGVCRCEESMQTVSHWTDERFAWCREAME